MSDTATFVPLTTIRVSPGKLWKVKVQPMFVNISNVKSLSDAFNAIPADKQVSGVAVPAELTDYPNAVFVLRGKDVFAVSRDTFSGMVASNNAGKTADTALAVRAVFGDMSAVNASASTARDTAKEEAKSMKLPNDGQFRIVKTGTNGFVESAAIVGINVSEKDTDTSITNKALNRLYATARKESAKGAVGCWSLYYGSSVIEYFTVTPMRYKFGAPTK